MNSLGPFEWKKGWTVLAVLLGLWGLATVEPETAEAVNEAIAYGAIGCLFWMIWQLMQYDR